MAKRGHFPREKGMQRIFEQTGIPLPPNPRTGLSPVTSESSCIVLPCMYGYIDTKIACLYLRSGDLRTSDLDGSDSTADDSISGENSESETSLEEARSHADIVQWGLGLLPRCCRTKKLICPTMGQSSLEVARLHHAWYVLLGSSCL